MAPTRRPLKERIVRKSISGTSIAVLALVFPMTALAQLSISPTSQSVAIAGNGATYVLTVTNPTASMQTFVPATTGVPLSWGVQLPASVPVAPGGSQDFNVVLTTPVGQAPGSYPFTVIVRTEGGLSYSAPGTLDIGTAGFFTITPCRLFDTRNAAGPDAAAPGLAPGETRLFTVGGRCALPADATSLSVNQTITGSTSSGELVLYRGDLPSAPNTSSISYHPAESRANNGLLELSQDGSGTFKVYNNSTGMVHFILDVSGYFQ